ncbi:MAG: hypothetical protein MUQ30_10125, partial [Anaerolineae bacterium]|nr:hypothetical protein [Anaerolineae bacterium]
THFSRLPLPSEAIQQDGNGRVFGLDVHQAAEDTYGRRSLAHPIQLGLTSPMVFVFDVLPDAEHLRLVAVTLQ